MYWDIPARGALWAELQQPQPQRQQQQKVVLLQQQQQLLLVVAVLVVVVVVVTPSTFPGTTILSLMILIILIIIISRILLYVTSLGSVLDIVHCLGTFYTATYTKHFVCFSHQLKGREGGARCLIVMGPFEMVRLCHCIYL